VEAAAIIVTLITMLTVLAILGSYLWAARADGRDQKERNRRRSDWQ
jgi:hypothetical protein